MTHYLIYIRRSYKTATAADVSDEVLEAVARSLLPPQATCDVIRDSGGHHSGATDERDSYRELIRRVQAGGIGGIAVYDLSRLARDVRLMANLLHELEAQNVTILAGNLPNSKFDSAVGRFMFHMLISAAQFQRDLDSERMKAQAIHSFEEGGHLGRDALGYRTLRTLDNKVVHPRTLVVVPEEAVVVQRVWELLATQSFTQVAETMNREGLRRREDRPWTRDTVKDIYRRRRFYIGMVTWKRGLRERPGRHSPIIESDVYGDAVVGVEARKRGQTRRPAKSRVYPLSGVAACACGRAMHGQTVSSRGREWRFYRCRACGASAPAVKPRR